MPQQSPRRRQVVLLNVLRQSPPATRIGDQERQSAAAILGEHWGAGRLDAAEFNERLDLALTAKTDLELIRVFEELPGNPAALVLGCSRSNAGTRQHLLLAVSASAVSAGIVGLAMGHITAIDWRYHELVRHMLSLL